MRLMHRPEFAAAVPVALGAVRQMTVAAAAVHEAHEADLANDLPASEGVRREAAERVVRQFAGHARRVTLAAQRLRRVGSGLVERAAESERVEEAVARVAWTMDRLADALPVRQPARPRGRPMTADERAGNDDADDLNPEVLRHLCRLAEAAHDTAAGPRLIDIEDAANLDPVIASRLNRVTAALTQLRRRLDRLERGEGSMIGTTKAIAGMIDRRRQPGK